MKSMKRIKKNSQNFKCNRGETKKKQKLCTEKKTEYIYC